MSTPRSDDEPVVVPVGVVIDAMRGPVTVLIGLIGAVLGLVVLYGTLILRTQNVEDNRVPEDCVVLMHDGIAAARISMAPNFDTVEEADAAWRDLLERCGVEPP